MRMVAVVLAVVLVVVVMMMMRMRMLSCRLFTPAEGLHISTCGNGQRR